MTSESVPVLSTEEEFERLAAAYGFDGDRAKGSWLMLRLAIRAERAASAARIEALTEALRDATTLLPPDRWKLLREPTRRLVEADPRAALTSEAHRG